MTKCQNMKKFLGGCDIVKEMFEKGELQKILNVKWEIIYTKSLSLQ